MKSLFRAWPTVRRKAGAGSCQAQPEVPIVLPGQTSWWERLVNGVSQFYARADWSAFVGSAWAERIMHVEVTDDFHVKQGRSTGRWVLKSGDAQLVVYLKRHYKHPRWRGFLATVWRGRSWSAGMQECQHLQWALAQGMSVPKVLAAGEFLGPWGKMQSFLAIEELTGMVALHQAIPLAARQLEPKLFRVWKAGLAREVARLTRFLHDRNFFHRDLYLCHFFVSSVDTTRVPTWTNRVYMIDFHRLAYQPIMRALWVSKDLGQLMYSTEVEGINVRDRLRYWRAYLGPNRRGHSGRWLRRIVLARARRYREHNARKALRLSS